MHGTLIVLLVPSQTAATPDLAYSSAPGWRSAGVQAVTPEHQPLPAKPQP